MNFALYSAGIAQTIKTNDKQKQLDIWNQKDLDEIRKKGFEHLQAGEWESASSAFENALYIEPRDGLSLYGKALALFNLKRSSEADEKLEVLFGLVLRTKENNQLLADSLVLSAVISAVQKKNSLAIVKLQKAVGIIPGHFDASFSLGRAYFENGEIEKSVAAFRQAVSIQPDHVKARFFLATALERQGNSPEALTEYRAILRLNQNSSEGNLGLGTLLLKIEGDRSADGLNALQRAVTLDERLYEAQVTLGKTFVRLNRLVEAIGHLKKAAALAPNNPEPHFQLAIAYRRLNRKAEADAETAIVKNIHERRRGVTNKSPGQ